MLASAFRGKRVVIVGVGHFGGQIEAARFMCRAGARVLATDLKPREKLERALAALAGEPIEWRLGEHREEDAAGADWAIVSPAVPKEAPFLRALARAGARLTTEMNLTIARLRAPIFAVTGSNGKSTTTALLGRAVEEAGLRAFVGGNIGRPLLNETDAIGEGDRVVLELSSFQLEDLRAAGGVRPQVAVVTNLTPNHLDRHGTFEAYAAAKRTIVERQEPEDAAVLNREDEVVLAFAGATRARIATFGIAPPRSGAGSYLREGFLCYRDEDGTEHRVLPASALSLPGRHNLLNALAVLAAIGAARLPLAAAARAIASFPGLPDRLELVRERRGVRWYNDSKATTPEAARAAIDAFEPPLLLIAGGQDKGMDPEPLLAAAAARARAVLFIGKVRRVLAAALEARAPGRALVFETLEDAVAAAERAAPPGATVLFSPGYASYDMFASYEERGERFRAAVRALPG